MNKINGQIELSPGHKTTATEDEGVGEDVNDEHLLSIDENEELDVGGAHSESETDDVANEIPKGVIEAADGEKHQNKENNNNENKSKSKPTCLTLESMGYIRNSTSVPLSQRIILHGVPTSFPGSPNSLDHPATRRFIFEALQDLGVELHKGALIGATPKLQVAENNALEPITIYLDSRETKEKILKAVEKKCKKGASSIPTLSKSKYYFTHIRPRIRSATNKHTPPPHTAFWRIVWLHDNFHVNLTEFFFVKWDHYWGWTLAYLLGCISFP